MKDYLFILHPRASGGPQTLSPLKGPTQAASALGPANSNVVSGHLVSFLAEWEFEPRSHHALPTATPSTSCFETVDEGQKLNWLSPPHLPLTPS